jgi:hypothetical protein
MQERNVAWRARFGLTTESFRWDLASATLRFEAPGQAIVASVCLVGTTSDSEGTFLWAWANEAIPPAALEGLERVRSFGEINGLSLFTTAEFPGSRAEALEILACAGRILDAEGVFTDRSEDVTCFFVLKSFHLEPSAPAG